MATRARKILYVLSKECVREDDRPRALLQRAPTNNPMGQFHAIREEYAIVVVTAEESLSLRI
jgi:hypothetical protein